MLPLETTISSRMKSLGFRKKAQTWRRSTSDSIQVVNLQKNPYGEQLYVNLGLFICTLGTELSPPENRCHIQARLERVVPDTFFESISSANSKSEPSPALLDALLIHGIKWLESIASPAGRKQFLGGPESARCLIDKRAREA